jgi:hypothetical protein
MILITQGATNTIQVTLRENADIVSGYYYLVRFINDESLIETSCIAVIDTEAYGYRISELIITERAGTQDESSRQGGRVNLRPAGSYTYYIYEQTSDTNLDYTLASKQLEVGKCGVLMATETVVTEYTGGTSTNQVYSGND